MEGSSGQGETLRLRRDGERGPITPVTQVSPAFPVAPQKYRIYA